MHVYEEHCVAVRVRSQRHHLVATTVPVARAHESCVQSRQSVETHLEGVSIAFSRFHP